MWDINSAVAGQEAADQYTNHPLGTFRGIVELVKIETINQKPCIKVFVRTDLGLTDVNIWPITKQNIQTAQNDKIMQDKLILRVRFMKGILVNLKAGTEDEIKDADWEAVKACFGKPIMGKPCRVEVIVSTYDPKYREVSFIMLNDEPDKVMPEPMQTQVFPPAAGSAGNFSAAQIDQAGQMSQPAGLGAPQMPPDDTTMPPF